MLTAEQIKSIEDVAALIKSNYAPTCLVKQLQEYIDDRKEELGPVFNEVVVKKRDKVFNEVKMASINNGCTTCIINMPCNIISPATINICLTEVDGKSTRHNFSVKDFREAYKFLFPAGIENA